MTEELLVSQQFDSTTAHALLGRAIFVTYLEDRRILKPPVFHTAGNVNEFRNLLTDKIRTYYFCQWLRYEFAPGDAPYLRYEAPGFLSVGLSF